MNEEIKKRSRWIGTYGFIPVAFADLGAIVNLAVTSASPCIDKEREKKRGAGEEIKHCAFEKKSRNPRLSSLRAQRSDTTPYTYIRTYLLIGPPRRLSGATGGECGGLYSKVR